MKINLTHILRYKHPRSAINIKNIPIRFMSTKKPFRLPKYGNKYFKDPETGIEYAKTFAKWKCSNKKCRNKWDSAYTWITFEALTKNTKVYLPTSEKELNEFRSYKQEFPYDGSILKEGDYLHEECRRCLSENNPIIYYDELIPSNSDIHKNHRDDLCAKCKSGHPCTESLYSLDNF